MISTKHLVSSSGYCHDFTNYSFQDLSVSIVISIVFATGHEERSELGNLYQIGAHVLFDMMNWFKRKLKIAGNPCFQQSL